MGIQVYNSEVSTDVPLVTTTETVVATLANLSTPNAGAKVILTGKAQVTTGTATTGLTPRIRRGVDITGTVVNEANVEQVEAVAGSTEGVDTMCEDTPGEVAGQSYVLTVQQAAATANGASLSADLSAQVIS
jgi:hypothetical protein